MLKIINQTVKKSPLERFIFAISCALLLFGAPFSASALDLGRIVVFSMQNQPLRAEIGVVASADELSSLQVKMASPEAFKQVGLDYTPSLSGITFTIENPSGNKPVIKLSSTQTIQEPFLDFLIEFSWASGRLVREYTFLLDAPESPIKELPPLAVPTVRTETTMFDPPKEVSRHNESVVKVEPAEGAAQRTVRKGDTLYKIAMENKPPDVSLDQMLVGLYRANKEAFSGKNMNRLKAGKILSIPDKATFEAIKPSEARKTVSAQTSDWTVYRSKLASKAAQASPKSEASQQESGGKITAKLEEPATSTSVAKDQLKLSRMTTNKKGKVDQAPIYSEEDKIANEKALEEANSRIEQLKNNEEKMRQLIEVQNQQLAELQKQSAEKPESVPEPVETPSKSFIDRLLEDKPLLAGGIGAILAILAALYFFRRGSKKNVGESSSPSPKTAEDNPPPEVDDAADENVETGEFDVIAKADLFITTSQYDQAEVILLEARQKTPEQAAITLKLLEIYLARKDAAAFESLASELHSEIGGDCPEWETVVEMGQRLLPEHPLFSPPASEPSSVSSTEPEFPAAPELLEIPDEAEIPLPEISEPNEIFDIGDSTEVSSQMAQEQVQELSAEAPSPSDEPFVNPPAAPEEDDANEVELNEPEQPALAPDLTDVNDALESAELDLVDLSLDESTLPPLENEEDLLEISESADAPELPLDSSAEAPEITAKKFDLSSISLDLGDAENAPDEEKITEAIAEEVDELAEVDTPIAGEITERESQKELQKEAEPAQMKEPTLTSSADLLDLTFHETPLTAPLDEAEPDPLSELSEAEQIAHSMQTLAPSPTQETPNATNEISDDEAVTTKLDLAKAYEEMGDFEGARELLQEVISEGSASQQAKAEQALARMSV